MCSGVRGSAQAAFLKIFDEEFAKAVFLASASASAKRSFPRTDRLAFSDRFSCK